MPRGLAAAPTAGLRILIEPGRFISGKRAFWSRAVIVKEPDEKNYIGTRA